jgi:hypothetical protein
MKLAKEEDDKNIIDKEEEIGVHIKRRNERIWGRKNDTRRSVEE